MAFYSAGWRSVAEDRFGLLLLPHWVGENALSRIALLDWYANLVKQMCRIFSLFFILQGSTPELQLCRGEGCLKGGVFFLPSSRIVCFSILFYRLLFVL